MPANGFFRRAITTATATVALVTVTLAWWAGPATASPRPTPTDLATFPLRSPLADTGYWVVNQRGGVASAGGAPHLGSLGPSVRLAGPIVAMAATPDGRGYWLASSTGGVYSIGDARYYGSAGSGRLNRLVGHVVGMASTSDGRGYWLASSSGGVYSFGDAKFYGAARLGPSEQIIAIAATPGGGGYWLASSTGHVVCFGDATYHGAAAGAGQLIVGFAATPNGHGYWLAGSQGTILAFGDAPERGSARQAFSSAPIVGMAAQHDGSGYWAATSTGSTYGFGPASTTAARDLARDAVAIVADPAPVAPAPAHPASAGAPLKHAALSVAVSDPAGEIAVRFAMAQVGKPYIWGATGPYGYDCSGLALASWRAAGVYLPRTAAAQYYAGAHIPLSQVQPGDLIFWASDPSDPATIYHVAISLGGDSTVQATQTGQNVQVLGLWGTADLVPLATRP